MKPLLYDICCCAGGATKGYQEAGFSVTGIDNESQPRYIGDSFIQMDCIEFLDRYITGEFERADAFHASPPCQKYSVALNYRKDIEGTRMKHSDLIAPVRERLLKTGLPFVIENVPKSPLYDYVKLNGTMFGLDTIKERWFECHGFEVWMTPAPWVTKGMVKAGKLVGIMKHGSNPLERCTRIDMEEAYKIDWGMNRHELRQAIPPEYTRFIGQYLFSAIKK